MFERYNDQLYYGMVMRQRALGGARLAGSTVKATMIITTVNDWRRSARSAGHPFVIRGLRRRYHLLQFMIDAYFSMKFVL